MTGQQRTPRKSAALTKLAAAGIRRVGSTRSSFRYTATHRRRLGAADLRRIRSLAIPPAWTDVLISSSASSRIQAMGRDASGRWQYLYHPSQVHRRERAKSRRLVHFIEALPAMRKTTASDLRRPGLPREKVLACILRILSLCFLRPGSEVYANENRSYGVATLRKRHVFVRKDLVEFDFEGKSGKRQQRLLRDRTLARVVKQLLALPGHEVFKFEDPEGRLLDVRRTHINAYIKEVMGDRFSAKDFRTWAGTLIFSCSLAMAGVEEGESTRARNQKIAAALRETAAQLGNTPAICKASYVHPGVLDAFRRGQLPAMRVATSDLASMHPRTLHPAERALLRFLRKAGATH